jgi:hypothetical protein
MPVFATSYDTNTGTWRGNSISSYGGFRITGQTNGWDGIAYSDCNCSWIMFDGAGNGGMYTTYRGWSMYEGWSDNCVGLAGSATVNWVRVNSNGNAYSSSEFVCEMTMYSPAYNYWSDVRLKDNIVTIPNAMDKVSQLRGVYYNWKTDPNNVQQVGMIAQEVQSIVPQAVTYNENQDMYCLNYDGMIPLLIEAIKELNAEIEQAEQRLLVLENR